MLNSFFFFFCLSYFTFSFLAWGQSANTACFFSFSYFTFLLAWGQSGNSIFFFVNFPLFLQVCCIFVLFFFFVSLKLFHFQFSRYVDSSFVFHVSLSFIFLFALVNQ